MPEPSAPTIRVQRLRDLLAKNFDDGDQLLGGNLLDRGGAMVIAGVQKVSKSFLAIQAALSVMTHRPFLGIEPPERDPNADRPVSVLMLQGEVGERRMVERMRPTAAYFGVDRAGDLAVAFTFHNVKIDSPDGLARIEGEFFPDSAEPGATAPDILILDPFAWFHSKEENSTPDMTAVCGFLDRLRRTYGVAVIIVHHQSKSGLVQNKGHKMRGSSVLAGWYETLISLDWVDARAGRGPRWVDFELRNGEAPDRIMVDFDPERNILVPVDAPDEGSLEAMIVDELVVHPEGLNATDLAKAIWRTSHHQYTEGATGLAGPIARLLDAGVIVDVPLPSTKGRPPHVFRLADDYAALRAGAAPDPGDNVVPIDAPRRGHPRRTPPDSPEAA